MSDTRPVAIRCAQWLEVEPFEMDLLAAEELRRLHTENERLREAARMALEALESLQGGCTDSDDGTVEAITVHCPEVIVALREALGEEK